MAYIVPASPALREHCVRHSENAFNKAFEADEANDMDLLGNRDYYIRLSANFSKLSGKQAFADADEAYRLLANHSFKKEVETWPAELKKELWWHLCVADLQVGQKENTRPPFLPKDYATLGWELNRFTSLLGEHTLWDRITDPSVWQNGMQDVLGLYKKLSIYSFVDECNWASVFRDYHAPATTLTALAVNAQGASSPQR